jgi:hypothetical protein
MIKNSFGDVGPNVLDLGERMIDGALNRACLGAA